MVSGEEMCGESGGDVRVDLDKFMWFANYVFG